MYSRLILTGIYMLASLATYAQFLLTGTVVNQKDNTSIPFANIGIINSTVGTCGYEDGSFKLLIPKSMAGQEVTFSAIGFAKFQTKIDTLNLTNVVISLNESVEVLKEIQVTPSNQVKTGTVGLESPGIPGFSRWGEALASSTGGSAWAKKIEIPQPVIDIKEANLHIYDNDLDSFNIRCRIMSVGKDNLPDKDLLTENVIFGSKQNKGWISVDLRPYDLTVDEDFYLVFEWIMDKEGARIAAEHEANALPWKLPHANIWNNELMVYLDENNELVKQKLTKSQRKECKEREFPRTWFGIKKTKTSKTNYMRKASMSPWIEDVSFDLVANIEYQWY